MLEAGQRGDRIELDFPATPPKVAQAPDGLQAALGLETAPVYVGRSRFDLLVVVDREATVHAVAPDPAALKDMARGVIVTAGSEGDQFDFVSRFFAPGVGVDEDPATGSAHCCLGPYWGERLNKPVLRAFQASRRGGILQVELEGDRVKLIGSAITTVRGELIDP